MILLSDRRKKIEAKIKANKTILFASFGFDGIAKSKLKQITLNRILNGLGGDRENSVRQFFQVLPDMYFKDSAFKEFTYSEIQTLVEGEQAYMLSKLKK